MGNEKLTKSSLAKALGISRPTLDKYLKEGFPRIESIIHNNKAELERKKIELENKIKLCDYDLNAFKKELNEVMVALATIESE